MEQRPPEDRDTYDGHANYREDLAPRPAIETARGFLRVLLAIAVTVTITRLAYKLLYVDDSMILFITGGIAGFVGLLGGGVWFTFLNRNREGESRPMGMGDVMTIGFFVFAFVIPFSIQRADDRRESEARVARMHAAEREQARVIANNREQGMAMLRRLGHFAEPGVVPPDFEVRDDGASVWMTYRGEKSTSISLARVLQDSDSPGGWRGCAFWTGGPHENGRYYSHFISPGMTLRFSMYKECIPEFRSAPLEFRVGEPTTPGEAAERAWWSESAFASPEGREKETYSLISASLSGQAQQTSEQVPEQAAEQPSEQVAIEVVSEPEPTASQPASTRDVIKCRDASGAIQFTQGYCPPGTTRVEHERN